MFNFSNKKDKKPENIKEVLEYLEKLETTVQEQKKELEGLKQKGKLSLQKISVVRFNPFSGVGSNQSFSIALLDANNNGVVITSLFSQEGNRVYGKPVENGRSSYELSNEEKEAIEKAIRP